MKFGRSVFRCFGFAVAAKKARSMPMGTTIQENTTYSASSSVYCGTGGTADISTITVASNICRVPVKRKLSGQAQEL